MELKNKYSKQIIYSNQKFEDQIWYNQQIMTFLNFSQFPESVFRPNFPENTFLKTKPNFSLTGKCFPLTNFLEDKQTQESLESDFPENEFRETNGALICFFPYTTLFRFKNNVVLVKKLVTFLMMYGLVCFKESGFRETTF